MSERQRVSIRQLPTGVPGLDQVIGGGLPEYSFNLIAGGPGTGKTTLVQQILFANASPEHPGLYFTVLGKPPLKMLRYQQQFGFFDLDKVDSAIRFVNLSQEVLDENLSKVLESIVREVEGVNPGIVVVDSFRTVVRGTSKATEIDQLGLQSFLQRLALYLTSWQATTFLVGEYLESEMRDNPVFTVADGILWLFQSSERNSTVRKLRVMKMRGQAPVLGLHTFRITQNGIEVFPRTFKQIEEKERRRPSGRLSTGVAALDKMMGGGIPAGDSVLVAGPSGSGKTMLAAQFIAEGVRRGEPGVIAVFEERPQEYLEWAEKLGFNLKEMTHLGNLKVLYLHPLDLSPNEAFLEIWEATRQLGAKRVVIDSLSGFEMTLAPTFLEDLRESLYRMIEALTDIGITVLMTVERVEVYNELRFSPYLISFLVDDIILQRYIELEGRLRKIMTVVKMRNSPHSKDLRIYEITSRGLVVGEVVKGYCNLPPGLTSLGEIITQLAYPGLIDPEVRVLRALIELREAPAETLAQRMGLQIPDLVRALDRLLALSYATQEERERQIIYRPVAKIPGQ